MQAKTFAILFSLIIAAVIVELIRRQKLTFKYSMFWLSCAALTLILAFAEPVLWKLANLAGFELLSNFIFFLALGLLCLLCLFQTVYINEQNNRTEKLAQTLALLDARIKNLEKPDSKETV